MEAEKLIAAMEKVGEGLAGVDAARAQLGSFARLAGTEMRGNLLSLALALVEAGAAFLDEIERA